VIIYLALLILVNSSFGNVLVAIRENPERATMLGYDVRKYQLAAFVIGSSLAGLSGVLYTTWGQYITPSSMGITAAAFPIDWIAVGGRSNMTATLLGTILLTDGFKALTVYGSQYALVAMGVLRGLPCSGAGRAHHGARVSAGAVVPGPRAETA
jgi:branched-chain amino acid transport system permease protein